MRLEVWKRLGGVQSGYGVALQIISDKAARVEAVREGLVWVKGSDGVLFD
jgi:hypothetical protein